MKRFKLNAQGRRTCGFYAGMAIVCAGALLFGDWVALVVEVGVCVYILYDLYWQRQIA